jgi:hypothetical protein
MRKILFLLLLIACCTTACGPSEQNRKEAGEIYTTSLNLIKNINQHDSIYVNCVQYLMREIQTPSIQKNKKKLQNLSDSIALLENLNDSLIYIVEKSKTQLNDLQIDKSKYKLFKATDSIFNTYLNVANYEYKNINEKMKTISLPVKDSEYTILLKLSFKADSLLNSAIKYFNNESAEFYEKYGLKEIAK